MADFLLRPMTDDDRWEVAELIYASINNWYVRHGAPEIFRGGPQVTEIFYDTYQQLTPGMNVVAQHPRSGRLMGSCFYHPRERHVSLGIMTVHPNHIACGVGRQLLQHIIDFTDRSGLSALRLTQSALNVDSFSLYNKAGFVPRYAYQDMLVNVPSEGFDIRTLESERVRPATLDDVPAMTEVELSVSGISREIDYRHAIENRDDYWHASVIEAAEGAGLDGYMISCSHTAMPLVGPGVARTEAAAEALILAELDQHRGRSQVVLVPMEKERLVRRMYELGARNVEMHFCQVRGEFQPFNGVNIPSFLPETG